MIADIVIFAGPPNVLSYNVPGQFAAGLEEGMRVVMPLGRRKAVGLIYEIRDGNDNGLRDIAEIIDSSAIIDSARMSLYRWICRYYHAAPRDTAGLFMPKTMSAPDNLSVHALIDKDQIDEIDRDDICPEMLEYIISRKKIKISTLKKHFGSKEFYKCLCGLEDRGLIKIGYRPPKRKSPDILEQVRGADWQELMLNDEQNYALKKISVSISRNEFRPFLLFGVTGSGKSEIYLKLIWKTLEQDKSVILMLPEIASSEQLYTRIRERLGDLVCRIHSGLKPSQRLAIWEEIRSGRFRVIIGPRSALFAPARKPGLIIVDEEHDSSFKQSGKSPMYHGRDAALVLARTVDCPVVLGSATPSLESWHNALNGKYELLRLTSRWDNRALPEITPVEYEFRPDGASLSDELIDRINAVFKGGGQVMLLLNRRGFAPTVKCADCGHTVECPNCSTSLVYHKNTGHLRCHSCDYQTGSIDKCPVCSGSTFNYFGMGTQRLEEEIKTAFPKVSFARLDLDSVSEGQEVNQILKEFHAGKLKMIIGTQMIAKSFDFPQVALMGILSADSYLEFPDFRSREKTFALLLQAAGRAGRGKFPGQVIIQFSPQYKQFIENVSEKNVSRFLEYELENRSILDFPPHKHLIMLHMKSGSRMRGEKAVEEIGMAFHRHENKFSSIMQMLGPAEAPLFKVRNNYRWQILFKTGAVFKSLEIIESILKLKALQTSTANLSIIFDVDPVDML